MVTWSPGTSEPNFTLPRSTSPNPRGWESEELCETAPCRPEINLEGFSSQLIPEFRPSEVHMQLWPEDTGVRWCLTSKCETWFWHVPRSLLTPADMRLVRRKVTKTRVWINQYFNLLWSVKNNQSFRSSEETHGGVHELKILYIFIQNVQFHRFFWKKKKNNSGLIQRPLTSCSSTSVKLDWN